MLAMARPLDPRAKLVEDKLYKLNLSARWLAERIGYSNVAVSDWLKGDRSPRDRGIWTRMLEEIKAFEAQASKTGELRTRKAGMITIPLYGGIAASPMNTTNADVELITVVDMETGNDQWARRVEGMSMFPLLEPGDIVVFDARAHEPGHVVHAWDDGLDCVKVVSGRGNQVQLKSVNPEFEDMDAHKANIKGVAVMRIRFGPNGEKDTREYPHGMRYRFEQGTFNNAL